MTNTPTQAAIEAAARALASWEGADWNAASFIGTPNGDEPDDMRAGYLEAATAAIEAYRAAMREAGFVEVPVEPTNKMIGQGWAEALGNGATGLECIEEIYRAMIAARPQIGGE